MASYTRRSPTAIRIADLAKAAAHPHVPRRAVVGRVQQAAQAAGAQHAPGDRAISPWRRPGERWLVALSGGKDSYGLLAAAARPQMARAAAGRAARLQSRPGAAEFPETYPAGFPDPARRRAPHRIPGHLFGGHRQDRRGQHLLLALLAAQARPSLPHRARGRLLVAGARPSPRGHPRDLLHEPVPWRPAGGDAAEAAQRRGRRHGAAAARATARRPISRNSPRRCSSRSSRAISAAARKGCSATP